MINKKNLQVPVLLLLVTIILMILSSCNENIEDNDASTDLKVIVYKSNDSTLFTTGATISLHLSEADMKDGIAYKTGTSNSSGICIFNSLGLFSYFVKGTGMAGSIIYTGDTMVATIADKEVTTGLILMSTIDTTEIAYNDADGVNGGKLYSKFYAPELYWNAPTGINETDITTYGDFYRCKQCHGWDLDGKTGAFIDRPATVSRPAVAGSIRSFVASSTIKQLYEAIENTGGREVNTSLTNDGTNGSGDNMPDYGKILNDKQIWNIVKFLKEEAFDVSQLYDIIITGTYPTGSKSFENIGKNGDSLAGKTYYTTNCSPCHGSDGKDVNLEGESIGEFIRQKPYQAQHKVKFGILGSDKNASIDDVKNLYKAGNDTLTFPDL